MLCKLTGGNGIGCLFVLLVLPSFAHRFFSPPLCGHVALFVLFLSHPIKSHVALFVVAFSLHLFISRSSLKRRNKTLHSLSFSATRPIRWVLINLIAISRIGRYRRIRSSIGTEYSQEVRDGQGLGWRVLGFFLLAELGARWFNRTLISLGGVGRTGSSPQQTCGIIVVAARDSVPGLWSGSNWVGGVVGISRAWGGGIGAAVCYCYALGVVGVVVCCADVREVIDWIGAAFVRARFGDREEPHKGIIVAVEAHRRLSLRAIVIGLVWCVVRCAVLLSGLVVVAEL